VIEAKTSTTEASLTIAPNKDAFEFVSPYAALQQAAPAPASRRLAPVEGDWDTSPDDEFNPEADGQEFDKFTVKVTKSMNYELTEDVLRHLLSKGAFRIEDGREKELGPIVVKAVEMIGHGSDEADEEEDEASASLLKRSSPAAAGGVVGLAAVEEPVLPATGVGSAFSSPAAAAAAAAVLIGSVALVSMRLAGGRHRQQQQQQQTPPQAIRRGADYVLVATASPGGEGHVA